MLIIPAIDLKQGRCVRLWRGIKEKETVYSQNPLQIARKWVKEGASRLHIVDLDGAFWGIPKHLEIAQEIKNSISVSIQYGGGIRSLKVMEEVLKRGIDFVIIGTRALSRDFIREAVARFDGKIIVSLDHQGGKVAVRGWEVKTQVDAKKLGQRLARMGIETFILTDITRDGTLEGVNTYLVEEFAQGIFSDLIIAGGVSTLEDIEKIRDLKNKRIKGIIIGKALYSGSIKLKEALRVAG